MQHPLCNLFSNGRHVIFMDPFYLLCIIGCSKEKIENRIHYVRDSDKLLSPEDVTNGHKRGT